jgi:hypothetical protein
MFFFSISLVFFVWMCMTYAETDISGNLLLISVFSVFFINLVGIFIALFPSYRRQITKHPVGNGAKAKENQDHASASDDPVKPQGQVRATRDKPIGHNCHNRPHKYPHSAHKKVVP